TRKDVVDLSKVVSTEFNIEGYPDERFMQMIEAIRPTQATLVPDPPHVLTSNAGWNTKEHLAVLQDIIRRLKSWGVRTSIFVDTDIQNVEYAQKTGSDRIEFYTGPYAEAFPNNPEQAIADFVKAAEKAHELGLGINAGHDLNMDNLRYFK